MMDVGACLLEPPTGSGPATVRMAQLDRDRACALFLRFSRTGAGGAGVDADASAGSIAVEANTTLMHTVYFHLNSYGDFEVRGHRRLELEFSPCMGVPIEVRAFDYPVGRPARFAFVEEDCVSRG